MTEKNKRSDYISIDKDILIKTYNENNNSLGKTGDAIGVSAKTIKRRMKEYDIKWDTKIHYLYNEKFFNDLNEKSLYWIGMFTANAFLKKRKYTYSSTIYVAEKDNEILKQFKADISFTGRVGHNSITISSEKLFNKLKEFNIHLAKETNYSLPDEIKNHKDINHFIRGCIDGAGRWSCRKNNGSDTVNEVRLSFRGKHSICKEIFETIKKICNINSGSIYFKNGSYFSDFEFSAHMDVKYIYNFIYNNANIYLKRKRNIASISENIKRPKSKPLQTNEQIDQFLIDKNIPIKRIGEYLGDKNKIDFECLLCNSVWNVTPTKVKRSYGCPKCSIRKNEKLVLKFLDYNHIDYEQHKRINTNGKIIIPDFFIPYLNLYIEYNGAQHYKPVTFGGISLEKAKEKLKKQIERDNILRVYCKENNINLLEIDGRYYRNSALNDFLKKYFKIVDC